MFAFVKDPRNFRYVFLNFLCISTVLADCLSISGKIRVSSFGVLLFTLFARSTDGIHATRTLGVAKHESHG